MQHRFYYSKSHEKYMIELSNVLLNPYHHTFVNGIKYTEMVTSDNEPCSKKHFGNDLVKVFEGEKDSYRITTKTLW